MKKRNASEQPSIPQSPVTGFAPGSNPFAGDAEVQAIAIPSGKRLIFEPDEEALLRFLSLQDIQDQVDGAEGPIIYLVFSDGKGIRKVSRSFKLQYGPDGKEIKWIPQQWYYIHCEDQVEAKTGKMNDYNIFLLGPDGKTVKTTHKGIAPEGTILLSDANCAEANYTRLNYPEPKQRKQKQQ